MRGLGAWVSHPLSPRGVPSPEGLADGGKGEESGEGRGRPAPAAPQAPWAGLRMLPGPRWVGRGHSFTQPLGPECPRSPHPPPRSPCPGELLQAVTFRGIYRNETSSVSCLHPVPAFSLLLLVGPFQTRDCAAPSSPSACSPGVRLGPRALAGTVGRQPPCRGVARGCCQGGSCPSNKGALDCWLLPPGGRAGGPLRPPGVPEPTGGPLGGRSPMAT